MKKGWKIGVGVAVVAVIALGVSAVAGKMDRRNDALKAIQNFFEVTKENELNQYLEYCSFEDLFFEKDVKIAGTFYTDIAKLTVQTDLEGIIDKSGKKVQVLGDVGLGGMPFAEFDGYSDDTNLYLDSEIFQDKMLKFNYTENLEEIGKTYGISHRNITMLQKGYISLFQMAVSQSKYEKIEEILKNDRLKEDLLQIYDTMTVERQENPDELAGGYLYQVNLPAAEVKLFLQDMASEYPEFEQDGYLNLVNKLVSEEKGVEISVLVNKAGATTEFSMDNAESGYEIILKRNEQKKENASGFESQFDMTVMKDGAGVLNGEILFDYVAADGAFELQAREDITGINVTAAGTMKADRKNEKFTIDIAEMKIARGEHDVDLKANIVATFGDFTVELPKKEEVDVIHGEQQKLQETQNLFWQEIESIAGSEIRQFLSSIGINY